MNRLFVIAIAGAIAAPALAQDTTAAPAAPTLPVCSAKVKDGCVQSAAQEKRAMTGEQADKRDARHGGQWAPDGAAAKPAKPQG